jgi:chorismate mutase/prephenate dehydratase
VTPCGLPRDRLYTYSHLAAISHFGQSVELAPVGNIAAVFEEVNRGQAEFGLVPIENSTDGRITDTLDMFTRLPVRICGEVELPIQHFCWENARAMKSTRCTASSSL